MGEAPPDDIRDVLMTEHLSGNMWRNMMYQHWGGLLRLRETMQMNLAIGYD
jgi:hypothetical protein